jgi:glutamine synthetase
VTPAEVAFLAEEAGLALVRFLWCGNDGTIRAKASGRAGLEGRLRAGIGVTVAMQAMSSLDRLQPVEGMGPVGEVRLVPELDSFRVLPYAPRTGAVVCDHVGLDGEHAAVCQRAFLRRMAGRLGGRLEVAFENEFSLAREAEGGYAPIDTSLCFSTIGLAASQDFADDLVDALARQRIVLEQYYAELGPGQQ